MKNLFLAGLAGVIATLSVAHAGPVAEFEAEYRQMYGAYRAALFKTSAGDAAASATAMEQFSAKLAALAAAYGDAPPPQYQDDPLWAQTMAEAAGLAAAAQAQVAEGDLAEAHETLEGVREAFSALHIRNGVQTFSDRMNAYHAEMEAVLALDLAALDDAMLAGIHEHAAVLSYLAGEVLSAPPAEAEGNADYAQLAAGFEASVQAFLAAARSGDPEAVKAAVANLKKPYSLLFVKFG